MTDRYSPYAAAPPWGYSLATGGPGIVLPAELEPFAAAPYDAQAAGWNPGGAGAVDTVQTIELLRQARDAIPEDRFNSENERAWLNGIIGRLWQLPPPEAAELDRIADELELLGLTDFGMHPADALRGAIDAASGGLYFAPGLVQPLFADEDDARGRMLDYLIGAQSDQDRPWDGDERVPVDMTDLLPMIASYADQPGLSAEARTLASALVEDIASGRLTANNALFDHLEAWQTLVRNGAWDDVTTRVANVIGGALVSGINRATGGAFTRDVFADPAGETEAAGRALLTTGTLGLSPMIEAAIQATGPATYEEARAAGFRNADRLAGELPGWTNTGNWTANLGLAALPWARIMFPRAENAYDALKTYARRTGMEVPWQQVWNSVGRNAAAAGTTGAIGGFASGRDLENSIERAATGAALGMGWSPLPRSFDAPFIAPLGINTVGKYATRYAGRNLNQYLLNQTAPPSTHGYAYGQEDILPDYAGGFAIVPETGGFDFGYGEPIPGAIPAGGLVWETP